MRGRHCGMACSDRDLVKIRDHVSHGVESLHYRLWVRIDLKASETIVANSQLLAQFGPDIAPQHWIDHVESLTGSIAHYRDHLRALPLERHHMPRRNADGRFRQIAANRFAGRLAIQ